MKAQVTGNFVPSPSFYKSKPCDGASMAHAERQNAAVRIGLGALGMAAILGAFTALDSESLGRGALALFVSAPLMLLALWLFTAATSRLAVPTGMSVLGVAVAIVPLGVGGKWPARSGGGPGPSGSAQFLLAVSVAIAFGLIGWLIRRILERTQSPPV